VAIRGHLTEDLDIVNIDFHLEVPKDVKFYGAHFKIDAFKWIAENGDKYSILIDNDVLCLNPMPRSLGVLMADGIPVYYDITDQVYPAYSQERIIRDKSRIMGVDSFGLWAGGELVGGPPDFFRRLHEECMALWPRYSADPSDFHHQSDEMVVSCAIEMLLKKNLFIIDAGKIGVITRYWSIKTLHIGRPLEAAYDNFLIHLPADKEYISELCRLGSIGFPQDYKRYCDMKAKRSRKRIWPVKMTKKAVTKLGSILKGLREER